MVKYVEGILRYNPEQDRVGIWRESRGWYIEGLHCGMCFDVFQDGEWLPVRIEYGSNPEGWYLEGLSAGVSLYGLTARWHVGW